MAFDIGSLKQPLQRLGIDTQEKFPLWQILAINLVLFSIPFFVIWWFVRDFWQALFTYYLVMATLFGAGAIALNGDIFSVSERAILRVATSQRRVMLILGLIIGQLERVINWPMVLARYLIVSATDPHTDVAVSDSVDASTDYQPATRLMLGVMLAQLAILLTIYVIFPTPRDVFRDFSIIYILGIFFFLLHYRFGKDALVERIKNSSIPSVPRYFLGVAILLAACITLAYLLFGISTLTITTGDQAFGLVFQIIGNLVGQTEVGLFEVPFLLRRPVDFLLAATTVLWIGSVWDVLLTFWQSLRRTTPHFERLAHTQIVRRQFKDAANSFAQVPDHSLSDTGRWHKRVALAGMGDYDGAMRVGDHSPQYWSDDVFLRFFYFAQGFKLEFTHYQEMLKRWMAQGADDAAFAAVLFLVARKQDMATILDIVGSAEDHPLPITRAMIAFKFGFVNVNQVFKERAEEIKNTDRASLIIRRTLHFLHDLEGIARYRGDLPEPERLKVRQYRQYLEREFDKGLPPETVYRLFPWLLIVSPSLRQAVPDADGDLGRAFRALYVGLEDAPNLRDSDAHLAASVSDLSARITSMAQSGRVLRGCLISFGTFILFVGIVWGVLSVLIEIVRINAAGGTG